MAIDRESSELIYPHQPILCSSLQALNMSLSLFAPQECSDSTASSFTPREPRSGCFLLRNGVKCILYSCGGL